MALRKSAAGPARRRDDGHHDEGEDHAPFVRLHVCKSRRIRRESYAFAEGLFFSCRLLMRDSSSSSSNCFWYNPRIAAAREQLVVRSAFGDGAAIKNNDLVGRRGPSRSGARSESCADFHIRQPGEDRSSVCVSTLESESSRIRIRGSRITRRNCGPLLLSTGESYTALTHMVSYPLAKANDVHRPGWRVRRLPERAVFHTQQAEGDVARRRFRRTNMCPGPQNRWTGANG